MECPFPGMDPYLEDPAIWPDFHDSLITMIRGQLQPLLRPQFVAVTQDRLYLIESQRPIVPDVTIVGGGKRDPRRGNGNTAVMEPDAPVMFDLAPEEVREPFITIVEPKGRKVITAIEVLSPSNKLKGPGRDDYQQKRDELRRGGANFVEIDLLREGLPTVRVPESQLELLPPWRYLVAVTRVKPARQEVYAFDLARRLPRIGVPLLNVPDVTLDLQAAFARCWETGPYPELLDYDQTPPGKLTASEKKWCTSKLKSFK